MIDLVDKILKEIKPSESEILNFSCYWIPLQWVYVELVKNGDLVPINEIPHDDKIRYKFKVNFWIPEKARWVRHCICEALYVYDQLKTE